MWLRSTPAWRYQSECWLPIAVPANRGSAQQKRCLFSDPMEVWISFGLGKLVIGKSEIFPLEHRRALPHHFHYLSVRFDLDISEARLVKGNQARLAQW
jgi:hypothetical protein